MASFDEFTSTVQSCIEALKQAQAGMDSPKQQAEELSNQFQGLGAESMAIGAQGLKDGVEQSQAMIPPVITQLEQLITSAQGMKNSGLTTQTPEVRPPPTPLDAAPTHLREPVAKIGDPTTAPTPQPGALQAELKTSDDDDSDRNRLSRFGRSMVRNIDSLQNQAKETTSASIAQVGAREPVETVGVPQRYDVPTIVSSNAGTPVQDIVANGLLMAAITVEGCGRLWRNRRDKKTR